MRYILKRLFQGIFILLGVSMITFFLPSLYFKPITLAIGVLGTRHVTHQDYVTWIHQQGLDKPILLQYWNWLVAALHGNFGISYKLSTRFHTVTVSEVLSGDVWRSVWLVLIPTVASIIVAIPIGLTQAFRRNKPYDHIMTTSVYVLYSTPAVLVCILLAYYFAIVLGIGTPTVDSLAQNVSPADFPSYMLHHFNQFILPFFAIFCLSIGGLTRYMRGSALDTLVQDYVRTAKAKGSGTTRVLFRHVLRPSVIPLITIIGLTIPGIIGGALIVEDIFNYPGMGLLTVNSVETGDFTVVMAITLFTAVLVVIGNLMADVFTAVSDPRVRLGAER
jgi:peptide/nickel transport system permease protein